MKELKFPVSCGAYHLNGERHFSIISTDLLSTISSAAFMLTVSNYLQKKRENAKYV